MDGPRPARRPVAGLSPATRFSILVSQRLDKRRVSAVAIALVLGLLMARTVLVARATTASLGPTTPHLVAKTELAAGQTITEADLRVEHHPVGLSPPEAATWTDQVIGAVVRSAIAAGEPVSLRRLGPGRLGLAAHERAVTLPHPLATPPVEPGDGVELVGVGLVPGTELVEARLLGPGRVLHHDELGITVAVSASLSTTLIEWLAAGAVDLVITPTEADTTPQAE